MMRTVLLTTLLLTAVGLAPALGAEEKDAPVYELRTYTTAPDKLPVLLERFGKHNLPIFERHGIELVGAWTPMDPEEPERLVYLVSFPSREAAKASWKAFGSDPEWQEIFGKEKEEHTTVVTKAESVFLAPTDYSPCPEPSDLGLSEGSHVYELRIYTASPDKLENLDKRFRDHTIDLFAKHGMTNVLYTHPMDSDKGADNVLTYFLAHNNRDAATASFNAFRDDPQWQKVYQESQPDGVRLAAEVVSIFLKPTEFSPLK